MGTVSADDFEWATKAALSGGTTMIVDFCIPAPGASMLEAYADWRSRSAKAACDYGFHMAVTSWSKTRFDEMATVVNDLRHQHLQALHGLQGRADGRRRGAARSFSRCAELGAMPLVHAENGDVGGDPAGSNTWPRASPGRRAMPFAPARGRGRGRQPRHHDRRHGGLAALRRSHLLPRGARGDRARPRARQARLWRAADPASGARRERVFQRRLGPRGAARDVAAVPRQGAPGFALGRAAIAARCRWSRPTIAPSPTSRSASGANDFPTFPTAPAGSRTACRCSGARASTPAG